MQYMSCIKISANLSVSWSCCWKSALAASPGQGLFFEWGLLHSGASLSHIFVSTHRSQVSCIAIKVRGRSSGWDLNTWLAIGQNLHMLATPSTDTTRQAACRRVLKHCLRAYIAMIN